MKVEKCPNCTRKNGFLAFREVRIRNQKYPYVRHYDPAKYEKEKKDYLSGKRKSKPSGKKCCNLSLFKAATLDFAGNWFVEYIKIIKQIHRKFLRFGFMNVKELNDFENKFPRFLVLKKIREKFIKNSHWQEEWKRAQRLLQDAGYSQDLANKKIRLDLFFRFELGRIKKKDFKHQLLHNIFLD